MGVSALWTTGAIPCVAGLHTSLTTQSCVILIGFDSHPDRHIFGYIWGVESNGLHDRLRIAAGSHTYRHLSELTGTHHETVRRYMQGQSPSVEFLAALCGSLGLSAEWVLTGAGPMRRQDVKAHALGEANVGDLLGAMSGTLERLIDRVERIERFVQSLETRFRASETGSATLVVKPAKNPGEGASGDHVHSAVQVEAPRRVDDVVGAVARRPRPDAG